MAIAEKTFLYRIGVKGAKKAGKDLKGVDKSMKRMRLTTTGLQRAVGVLRNKLLLFTFATAGIIAVTRKVVAAFIEQETAVRKLETVLRSTGGVAGITSRQLQSLAAELQSVTIFGDETIITAQSLLLTFTQIGSDVFPQALEAILNVSTAMGTDLQSSVLQLGKALNDPILGVAALTRVGIQLTETQKEQIKIFAEQGKTAEAQKIILGELETQFGGLARAMVDTTEGAIKQMTMAFGDMTEVIGEGLAPAIISLSIIAKRVFEEMALDIGKLFGILTPVEELQRRLIRSQQILSKLEGGLLANTINKELIASFRLEVEELTIAIGALQSIEDILDKSRLGGKQPIPEVSEATISAYQKFLNTVMPIREQVEGARDIITDLGKAMAQAAVHGQKMGEAISSAIRSIVAELLAAAIKKGIFALINLALPGLGTFAGASMFSGISGSVAPIPNDQPQGTTVIFQNAVLIGADEMAIRDTLIPLIDQARANA